MTAIAGERRRTTVVAAVLMVVMGLAAASMAVVGVVTLSNSREGEAVGIDDRPRQSFPVTPNGLLAIHDDEGRLTSLIVVTLLPGGQGGSIVTVPVNADSSAGFGLQRRPLDQSFAPDDVEGLVASVEEMLSITIERASVVGPDALAALLADVDTLELVLPQDVVNSTGDGDDADDTDDGERDDEPSGGSENGDVVVTAGPQTLTRQQIVDVLTASDATQDAYAQHRIDVEVWAALARTAPVVSPPEPVTTDEAGNPTLPGSVRELLARMWEGEVGVRDLATVRLVASENPTDEDVVLLDRRDVALVFAQISPGLVSTATTGMRVRVVAPFTTEQLAAAGYASSSELLLDFIGAMMFVQASVVSIDSTPTGADEVTVLEVTQASRLGDISSAEALFGPSEVGVAETVIDGVDLVVVLGTAYLTRDDGSAEPDDTTPDTATTLESTDADGTIGTVGSDGTSGDG